MIATDNRETFRAKGETHYIWPLLYVGGNSARCSQCRYYLPHEKASLYFDGDCTSRCHNEEKGYIHRRNGNDHTSHNNRCKWFYLKSEDEENEQMEQMELFDLMGDKTE